MSQKNDLFDNGNIDRKLNNLHNLLKEKIFEEKEIKTERKNAKELQKFFQELKNYNPNNNNFLEELTYTQVIKDLRNKGFEPQNLFKNDPFNNAFSGAQLENDLMTIIEAIWKEIADDDQNFIFEEQKVLIGTKRGSTVNLEGIISEKNVQNILKKTGVKTKKYFQDEKNKKEKLFYLQDIDGKVDVQGYEINIKNDASEQLKKIYDLLKDATFSAKNYLGKKIEIGETNIFRAITGTLRYAYPNEDESTIINTFYHGYNIIKRNTKNAKEMKKHFYHLRYIYELMGTGFRYIDKTITGNIVKYLIYNDPNGNIYVISTKDLAFRIFNSNKNYNSLTGEMTISSSVLQKMATKQIDN